MIATTRAEKTPQISALRMLFITPSPAAGPSDRRKKPMMSSLYCSGMVSDADEIEVMGDSRSEIEDEIEALKEKLT